MKTGYDAFLLNDYWAINDKKIKEKQDSYNQLIDYKSQKMMPYLFGKPTDIGLVTPIDKEQYTQKMFEYYKSFVSRNLGMDNTRQTVLDFLNSFTEEELLNNKTERDLTVGDRLYQKGTRVYKIIRKFGKMYNIQYDIESKMFGSLRFEEDKVKDIYLSVRPEHFLQATSFGKSCLSPDGDHQDSALMYPVLPYSLLAYAEDDSWRAFVMFSPEQKVFTQMPGYPRENFYAQVVVRNFFESKGYTMVSSYKFNHSGYQDMDVFRLSVMKEEHIPRVPIVSFLDRDLYLGSLIKNTDYKNIIAAFCDRCDRVHVGEYTFDEGMCDGCYEEE